MFIHSFNVKLNKFGPPSFKVRPVLGCNINISRVSDIFFAGK